MIVLRILLLPISLFYGLIIQLRNLLYDNNLLQIHRFNKKIISVGNLTAGGSGKTPFTVYLANKLIERGRRVAVVSRGYGRKSKGFVLVSDGSRQPVDPQIHGDEPALIALLVPAAVVAVAEQRATAINHLLRNHEIDTIILDDGFQHRAVKRDVDIVLEKDSSKLINRIPVPSGLLREFRFNIKRADVVVDRDVTTMTPDHYHCSFRADGLYNGDFIKQFGTDMLAGKKCVVFAGIADPAGFRKTLEENQVIIGAFFSYKDHCDFNENDLHFLLGKCHEYGCRYLLCTLKDLVKIRQVPGYKKHLQKNAVDLLAPGLKIILSEEPSFLKKIESHLD